MGGRGRLLNDIEILREMFVFSAQVPLQQETGKRPSVQLTDVQADSAVEIRGLPHDSIVIRAEEFSDSLSVFCGSRGERRRADFVIVSLNERKWIIYIETQLGDYKEHKDVVQQLKGALCFVNYCKCIGKEFWSEREFLDDYEFRFVSMVHTSLDKRSTSPNRARTPVHSRPEIYLRISGKSHHFNRLTDRVS